MSEKQASSEIAPSNGNTQEKIMDQNLEVAVNYQFSEILKALEEKGLFGKDEQTCRAALTAISIESGNRQFTLGMSVGAGAEAEKKFPAETIKPKKNPNV